MQLISWKISNYNFWDVNEFETNENYNNIC